MKDDTQYDYKNYKAGQNYMMYTLANGEVVRCLRVMPDLSTDEEADTDGNEIKLSDCPAGVIIKFTKEKLEA